MQAHHDSGGTGTIPEITQIPDEALDPSLIAQLPVEWARTHGLLPIRLDGQPCVLVADAGAVAEIEYLELLTGLDLDPVVAEKSLVLSCIERCYYARDNRTEALIDTMASEQAVEVRTSDSTDLLRDADRQPVTQLINAILLQAVKQQASDIHLEPFRDELRLRYRIDGVLYEQAAPPKQMELPLVSRLKVMSGMDIAERRLPQDGVATVRVGEREIDVRASTVPVAAGERVVLRLLDRASALLPLDVLGMEAGMLTAMEALLDRPSGLLVVCGPTGSGKTTTLYAMLQRLDAVRKNIMTIEDPIEYRLPDIGQIQVKPKIGLTFANGLRHILRQDPDVVLVGEIRDAETGSIAVRASLTGHLVLTTLHTNDAAGAVTRLLDLGLEGPMLATCLRGVLAQRLVRKLCPSCMQPGKLDALAATRLGADSAGSDVYEPVGCDVCLEGYRGRTGLFELLEMTDGLTDAVRRNDVSVDGLRREARSQGMLSLRGDGLAKVRAGSTSVSEVLTALG